MEKLQQIRQAQQKAHSSALHRHHELNVHFVLLFGLKWKLKALVNDTVDTKSLKQITLQLSKQAAALSEKLMQELLKLDSISGNAVLKENRKKMVVQITWLVTFLDGMQTRIKRAVKLQNEVLQLHASYRSRAARKAAEKAAEKAAAQAAERAAAERAAAEKAAAEKAAAGKAAQQKAAAEKAAQQKAMAEKVAQQKAAAEKNAQQKTAKEAEEAARQTAENPIQTTATQPQSTAPLQQAPSLSDDFIRRRLPRVYPRFDIQRENKRAVITANLPGVTSSHLTVLLDHDTRSLTVKGWKCQNQYGREEWWFERNWAISREFNTILVSFTFHEESGQFILYLPIVPTPYTRL